MRRPKAAFQLSLRENALNGVSEARVWATRSEVFNAKKLMDDSFVGGFRFLVGHEQPCDGDLCQVWTAYFRTYEEAKAYLDEHGARGENGSLFAILPAGFVE